MYLLRKYLLFTFSIDVFAPGGSRKLLSNHNELSKLYPGNIITSKIYADYDDPICAIGEDKYSFLTLSSGALPHVTAAVAIIKSFIPNAGFDDIINIISSSTKPFESSGNIMEGLSGRLSLRLLKKEIEKHMYKDK